MVKQSSLTPAEPRLSFDRLKELAAAVLDRCDALSRCSDDAHRIARVFCSPAMHDAHRLVSEWMKATGMTTRVDAAANFIGSYYPPGCDSQRRVMIASHLDTVIDAGRYDGILGVMMGIAAVEALRETNAALPWAIDVVGFSDEEGVRFGAPFLGSRAMAGTIDDALLALRDDGGMSILEAIEEFGLDPAQLAQCAVAPGDVVAYVEPHIEQGPLLELIESPVGIVSAIAGQTRLTIQWSGEGGHAGTVPMNQRHDPLVAACRWASAADQLGRETPGLVATVGRFEVDPNISNCIARRVTSSLDVRHQNDEVRTGAVNQLAALAHQIGADARLTVAVERDHEHAATPMDGALTDRLAAAISAIGHEPQRLVSGAGHDAGVMAAVAPAAMLFLRSPGGVSHHPNEMVTATDVAVGLGVLLRFLEDLPKSPLPAGQTL